MRVGELGEHPADLARLRGVASAQQASERLALGGHALDLAEGLAYQAPGPQHQPAGHRRIRHDRLAHPGNHEFGVIGIRQHLIDQSPCLRIEQVRDRPVEVSRNTVTDIGLDQSFEPVGGTGTVMERIQGLHERLHGGVRLGVKFLEPPQQPPEVAVLGDGHFGQRHLVAQGLRDGRGIGQPEKTTQGRIGQHPEQVDHAFSRLTGLL